MVCMAIPEHLRELRSHVGHAMIMIPSVSAVVVNDDGELLLGRRSDDGRWSLLAGIQEPGEQPAAAIVREVFEEAAVEVRVERLLGVALHPRTYPNGDVCQFANTWFLCRVIGGEARVNDDESLAVGWFALQDLPPIAELTRQRIEWALAPAADAWFSAPATKPH